MTYDFANRSAEPNDQPWKLYKRRWFIMILFMIYTMDGALQWGQFTIISNLVSKYYNVSETLVEWTANVFLLFYILFIIPALYVLDKLGLRKTMIIASLGMAVGTWIKVFSVNSDRFTLVMIGQSFEGLFLLLTFGLAARFTAIWFGANEISIAGSLALFGDQLGSSFGFLLPSIFVEDSSNEEIGNGLQRMHLTIAILSTCIFLLIAIFFEEQPKIPPSLAQITQKHHKTEDVLRTLIKIVTIPSFALLILSYGCCIGSFNALVTILNQVLLINFPGHTDDSGNVGFIIMVSGILSSLIVGKILDKTRRFKESAVILTIGATLSTGFYTWALKSNNLQLVYLASVPVGISALGYYATGAQMGIEITYPVSEGISSAVMLLSVQTHGVIITSVYGYLVKAYGDLISNITLTLLFLLSVVFAMLMPKTLQRQAVEKSKSNEKSQELKEFL